MKSIFVIGAGFTGIELSRMLIRAGKRVTLIDNDPERVRHASDQLDCTVMTANGNDLEVLEKAGIAGADALIALTDDDEINMITCSLVDAVYPDVLKIARVRNYAYYNTADLTRKRLKGKQGASSRPLYGVDFMLNPDVEAARALGWAFEHGAIGNVIDLGDGYLLTTLSVGEESPLLGVPLWQMASLEGWHYLIAFVESDGRSTLPNGATTLKVGDTVGIVSKASELGELSNFTKTAQESFKRVVLFGGDRVGTLLLDLLEAKRQASLWSRLLGSSAAKSLREFVVIDQDAERCRELAQQFPSVRVLCGDITDEALLTEERLSASDLMIAASGNHELNLVTAAYMKLRGVKKCMALAVNAAYGDVARKLGVDVTVAYRGSVVDGIIGHLRGRHVEAVHSVCNHRFEIVEGEISPTSPLAGHKVADVAEKLAGCLILLAETDDAGTMAVPNGETELMAGARVVLIAPSGDTKIMSRFFGKA